MNDYRSRLRSSPKQASQDTPFLTNMATDDFDFSFLPSFAHSPSPRKGRQHHDLSSPHKSGYFLRTPSPLRKLQNFLSSPTKSTQNELPGTPSPHKPTSATDLFGNNKSLLDNLDVPEDWDDNFLSNFQDDWLMAIGTEDLESLGKSPLKSPGRGQTFLLSNPKTASPAVSPFKSPLLTSSPKHSGLSPLCWGKTPAANGNRPVTRQRKLILHSPEKVPQSSNVSSAAVSWNAPLPFSSMLDASSSSAFSEGFEATSTLQSISSYLKNFDDDSIQEDLPVMPPAGWTSKSGKVSRTGKTGGKGGGKVKRDKKITASQMKQTDHLSHQNRGNVAAGQSQHFSGKKLKMEPQFTLLRPHTELHTHQISLRTTPVTPPNKIKISRDFSQIQTLPSKEQLRIVRNRFTETLNKAVEQVIEREKTKKAQNPIVVGASTSSNNNNNNIPTANIQQSSSQYLTPGVCVPMTSGHPHSAVPQAVLTVKPPPLKRKKR